MTEWTICCQCDIAAVFRFWQIKRISTIGSWNNSAFFPCLSHIFTVLQVASGFVITNKGSKVPAYNISMCRKQFIVGTVIRPCDIFIGYRNLVKAFPCIIGDIQLILRECIGFLPVSHRVMRGWRFAQGRICLDLILYGWHFVFYSISIQCFLKL